MSRSKQYRYLPSGHQVSPPQNRLKATYPTLSTRISSVSHNRRSPYSALTGNFAAHACSSCTPAGIDRECFILQHLYLGSLLPLTLHYAPW